MKPNYTQAYYNLGNTLKDLGRHKEAEESYNQALLLKPNYTSAYNNLGNIHKEQGRLEEAENKYKEAIKIKPNFLEGIFNLSIIQSHMNNLEGEISSLKKLLQIDSDNYGLRAGVNLGICNFLKGDFKKSKKYLLSASNIKNKTSSKFKNEKIYWKYLLGILIWHE